MPWPKGRKKEIIEKIRQKAVERYKNPAMHEKTRKAMLKYYALHGGPGKSTSEKISRSLKRYYRKDPLAVERMRKSLIKHYTDNPEDRKKISRIVSKRYKKNPELKRKIDRTVTEWWRTHPEAKKRFSRFKKLQYKTNPELRKKIDKIVTQWWKDNPSARKKQSQRIKLFFINNPKAFEEFLKHGKNPLKPHLKTSQGFIVRSKGEKQIANFLHKNHIPSLYESFSLPITSNPFKGNICTPDFYIPSLNIFIEFYGGHPQSYKKKVLKNKLYKAHKIPVLAITPAELDNLDYYLLKQGKDLSESKIAGVFKVRRWIRD